MLCYYGRGINGDDKEGTLKEFIASNKAPWVSLVVLAVTAVAAYLLIHDGLGVEKAAYQFSAILIGGFLTKALIAVGIGAMRTMFLMVLAALALIVITITFTDASVFKDAAVEGLLAMAGGSLIVLIGALLERHKA